VEIVQLCRCGVGVTLHREHSAERREVIATEAMELLL
jgi:hypothetical protein